MSWDDILKGTSGADIMNGGSGDDFLQGKAGGDTLDGGSGDDLLHGDSGDDHLRGGAGNDFIDGGTGIDTAYYSGSIVEYSHSNDGENLYINHTGGSRIDGNDRLLHVERLVFADAVIDLTQNNAPVAFNDVASTHEDVGTYNGSSVLANDFDWEGDSLSAAPGTTAGVYGTLVMNANGTYTYTPNAAAQSLALGQTAQDTFSYTVSDGSLSDIATLTITVAGRNDAPVANPDTASTGENSSVSVNVLANDTDIDNGAVLTVATASAPVGQGSASVVANQVVFNPGTDFDYLDTGETANVVVSYTISDEHGATSSSSVTITVDGANDAPVANDDNASTSEDASVSGNVLANDTDIDVEPLTVTNPGTYVGAYGTLTLAADGSYTYAPNAAAQGLDDSESGQDVFSYTASDGTASDTATLTVTVNGVNDAPMANDDAASATEDGGASGNVLTNDTDVDGEALTVASAGTYVGTYGTLTVAADGSYTYAPGAGAQALDVGESAQDVFTYTASDGTATDAATLTVTVSGLNDAPVANDDNNATDENSPVSGNVLANDTDVDGETLTVTNAATFIGAYGTLVLAANGNYTYTPGPAAGALTNGQVVNEVFTYIASDGTASDTATLTVTVTGLSGVPNANDDTASTTENANVSGNVLTNDTDPEGDALTVSDPGTYIGSYGTLTLAANGSYTYAPNAAADGLAAGESAQDVFTYTATDGGASDTATLTVTVNGTNDAPTIDAGGTDSTGSVSELDDGDPGEGTTVHTDSGAIAFDDVDVNDTHSASFTPQGAFYLGTFSLDPVDQTGDSVTWNFSVSDAALEGLSDGEIRIQTYSVEVDDGHGGTATQNVTVTITGAGVGVGPQTVWFIDNSAVGSANLGTQDDPYTSIAAFNAAQGSLGGPQAGHTVHLLAGTGTYAEADGINLLDGQILVGDADGPVRPTIVATAGDGIDVAENNTISGIDIGSTSGAGIDDDGGTVGTLTVSDVGIGGARTGQIVDIDHGGTLSVELNEAGSTASSGGAIDLAGVDGSFTVGGATSITGVHSGGGVDVTGSSASVTLNAGIVSTGANTGINFVGNSGSLAIGGGLAVVTTSGTGLNAAGGGTVSVTGAGNSVTSTTGTAVNISGTTIGAAGITLDSVSSSGAVSGVVLANTGAGGFSVTGTGTAGSGGTIAGSTNAGISLTNTGLVSLTDVTVSGGGDDGIRGSGVNGLELTRATIASNGNALGERGVDLTGLTGVATVTDSSFTGSGEDNFSVVNSSGTLDLTVTGSTFGDLASPLGSTADDGLIIQGNGTALIRASVTGSTFTNNRGDHFQYATDALATSTAHITFNDNILTSTFAGVLGGGITISPGGGATLFFAVEDNNIQGANSTAIAAVTSGTTATGDVHGTITGNTIGTAGVANSGSVTGNGINVQAAGAGTITVLVDGNDIHGWANAGINSLVTGSGRLNATITDNVIDTPGGFALNSIRIVAGASSVDSAQIYLELGGNDASTALAQDIFVRTRFNADILLPGYGGAAADGVAVDAFLTGKNPLGGEVIVAPNALAGSGFFDTPGSAAVLLPTYPDTPMM
ncbi:MAG TPA: Ig-like domain-containing protein [Allosphingosinicella sp.]